MGERCGAARDGVSPGCRMAGMAGTADVGRRYPTRRCSLASSPLDCDGPYAVVVAGFSIFLLIKAFDLLSGAGLAVAEEAAAVTASAAAVTALATIALVWTAVQQATEARKRAAPLSMRWYTKWTRRPHLVYGIIQPDSEGTRPIRELYRGALAERR